MLLSCLGIKGKHLYAHNIVIHSPSFHSWTSYCVVYFHVWWQMDCDLMWAIIFFPLLLFSIVWCTSRLCVYRFQLIDSESYQIAGFGSNQTFLLYLCNWWAMKYENINLLQHLLTNGMKVILRSNMKCISDAIW